MKKRRVVLVTIILLMFILVMILVNKTRKNSEHIASPEDCASQWIEDGITVEETFNCIENYTKKEQVGMRGQEP